MYITGVPRQRIIPPPPPWVFVLPGSPSLDVAGSDIAHHQTEWNLQVRVSFSYALGNLRLGFSSSTSRYHAPVQIGEAGLTRTKCTGRPDPISSSRRRDFRDQLTSECRHDVKSHRDRDSPMIDLAEEGRWAGACRDTASHEKFFFFLTDSICASSCCQSRLIGVAFRLTFAAYGQADLLIGST